jgi:hypothetical protein
VKKKITNFEELLILINEINKNCTLVISPRNESTLTKNKNENIQKIQAVNNGDI